MKKITLLGVLTLLGFGSSVYAQESIDGFFSERGALSITTSYTNSSFDSRYVGRKEVSGVPFHNEINQDIYAIYAKYELIGDLVAFVNVPYIMAKGNGVPDGINGRTSISDFQNISFGLKFRVHNFKFEKSDIGILSGLTIGLPGDYEPNGVLSLGSGEVSTKFTTGFHLDTDVGFFSTLLASYSFRDDAQYNGDFNVPNAFIASAKLGYASEVFYIDAWAYFFNSVSGVDLGTPAFSNNFPETRVMYASIGASLSKSLSKNFAINLGYGAVVDGRNLGRSTTITGGITYNLQLL